MPQFLAQLSRIGQIGQQLRQGVKWNREHPVVELFFRILQLESEPSFGWEK